jgi:hypothetical protein
MILMDISQVIPESAGQFMIYGQPGASGEGWGGIFLFSKSLRNSHYLGLRFAKVRGINSVHEVFQCLLVVWPLSIGRGHRTGI